MSVVGKGERRGPRVGGRGREDESRGAPRAGGGGREGEERSSVSHEQCQHLHRLPETHLVGQDTSQGSPRRAVSLAGQSVYELKCL